MAKLTIAEVTKKTSRKNDPYLLVKSSNGNLFSVWEQYLFHLFIVGETLEVTVEKQGAFSNIVAVEGVEKPNQSGGVTVAKYNNGPAGVDFGAGNSMVGPSAWDKLWLRLDNMESKIDFLLEERKTLGEPNLFGGEGKKGNIYPFNEHSFDVAAKKEKEINLHHPLPNLSGLPVIDLPDLNG